MEMITISKQHYNKLIEHAMDQSIVNAWIKLHERTEEQLKEARQETLRLIEQQQSADVADHGQYIHVDKYNELEGKYIALQEDHKALKRRVNTV